MLPFAFAEKDRRRKRKNGGWVGGGGREREREGNKPHTQKRHNNKERNLHSVVLLNVIFVFFLFFCFLRLASIYTLPALLPVLAPSAEVSLPRKQIWRMISSTSQYSGTPFQDDVKNNVSRWTNVALRQRQPEREIEKACVCACVRACVRACCVRAWVCVCVRACVCVLFPVFLSNEIFRFVLFAFARGCGAYLQNEDNFLITI